MIKHVINDDAGSAAASDFTLSAGGCSFPGAEAPGTVLALKPGAFSVSESSLPGYTATLSSDCSGTLGAGEPKTCTLTNDDSGGGPTPTATDTPTPTPSATPVSTTPTVTSTPTNSHADRLGNADADATPRRPMPPTASPRLPPRLRAVR